MSQLHNSRSRPAAMTFRSGASPSLADTRAAVRECQPGWVAVVEVGGGAAQAGQVAGRRAGARRSSRRPAWRRQRG